MFKKAMITNRKNKGFVAVTFAAMATVLVGFSGMAIDAGYMQWNKRRLQMAADAAAMGALRELEKNRTGTPVIAAGVYDASLNGFTNGQNNTVVTVSNPPSSGSYAGNNNAVQVRVQRNFPTLFMRIFGQNSVNIAAVATAHTSSVTGSIGGCIFALNKTMKSAININGTSLDLFMNCSLVDESRHGEAYTMGGGAKLKLGNGAQVGVVGGWSLAGQSQILDTRTSPATVISPIRIQDPGDPFAAMPEPTPANTGNPTIQVASGGVAYSKNNKPAGNTIQPGIYCGGISLGDTDGETYTFAPGIYIIGGGGFSIASSARAQGTGVTFYITEGDSTWGCPNKNYSPVALSGQGHLNFTAPTSGPFVGMLFFQDRTLTDNGFSQIVGGSGSTFDGALYFKTTAFKYAGNSSANGYTVVVADNISINGTSRIGNNYTSLAQPNPFAPYTTGGGLAE